MILDPSYKEDLLEYISDTPDVILQEYGHTKESVMEHIEVLWTKYQKDVQEYGCTPEWSYADVMEEVLGILIPNHAAPCQASEPSKTCTTQQTYADKIRQMSDEELAKLLVTPFLYMAASYRPDIVFRCIDEGDFDTREEAEEAALKMLQQPKSF